MRKQTIIIASSVLALALFAPACGDSGDTGSGTGTGTGTGDTTGGTTDDATTGGTTDDASGGGTTDSGTGDDAAMGGGGDDSSMGGGDDDSSMGGGDDDSSMGAMDGGPAMGDGACTNDADLAIISDETVDVTAIATTAGTECLFAGDPGTCASEKVIDETGLTGDCAGCYVEQILCAISECLAQCAPPNEASDACGECRAENCTPLFEPCSGIAPTTDEE